MKRVVLAALLVILTACAGGSAKSSNPKPTLDMEQSHYTSLTETKDFVTYPDTYKGKKIAIQCEVFSVHSTSEFQCWTLDTEESVYVETDSDYSRLYEDDKITVFGVGSGEACGKNKLGGEVCSPLISKAWYTKP